MVVAISPWVVSTSLRNGMFIPIASNGSMALWFGNNPHVDLTQWFVKPTDVPAFTETWDRILALPFKDQGAAYQREVLQFVMENPLRFLGDTFQKAVFLWGGATA
jgi:hypothetical protein